MRRILIVAALLFTSACVPVEQPAKPRTVVAIEVPLKSRQDHDDLLAMLHRHAAADGQDGIHVDDATKAWVDFLPHTEAIAPEDRGTIFVGVWRGSNDDMQEIGVSDLFHPGRAWLTFARGEPAERSTRLREGLLAEIRVRWPEAKTLPVMEGVIPPPERLEVVDGAYRIIPSRAANYGR
ncbi:hypothetical protein DDF62_18630 [Caulobacter radicis]|uniref:hypothetical protein n=1 Tax=Caulobacter radicis TaxID=2172650 RepID=UPI000D587E43|nr:hypothetical protein [Caulobacter radicis]PVM86180.1 hypothetical protein DDF62_18630 [Caulobacter radicis]